MKTIIRTAEAIGKAHPDKFTDLISDSVLDECLKVDPDARVACEAFATKGLVVIGGEITTAAEPDYKAIVQGCASKVGYDLTGTELIVVVHEQSPDIAQSVDGESGNGKQGAGDNGIMIGYATDETLGFLPVEYDLALKTIQRIEDCVKSGAMEGYGLDCKSQISVEFEDDEFVGITKIVVCIQHSADKDISNLQEEMKEKIIDFVFSGFDLSGTEILLNPSGRFVVGGTDADTGLTGRKIVADAYGPRVPVGGGAFSGKDPSKVDRSGAYFARYVARNIVEGGLAEKCQVTVAYAIGKAEPLAVNVDTFGTGKAPDDELQSAVLEVFNFRPAEIIKALDLKKPVFSDTATGGHFGREGFSWERADRVTELRKAVFGGKLGKISG